VVTKPDARVQDDDALHEIELYGELIIAASASDGPLEQVVIDGILGVVPAKRCVDRAHCHPVTS
jgi:hypothetical protein